MKVIFTIIDNIDGIEYSSDKYDIFFFQDVVEIYEMEDHFHHIDKLENDEFGSGWKIRIDKQIE